LAFLTCGERAIFAVMRLMGRVRRTSASSGDGLGAVRAGGPGAGGDVLVGGEASLLLDMVLPSALGERLLADQPRAGRKSVLRRPADQACART
jgi:hypothetical protein